MYVIQASALDVSAQGEKMRVAIDKDGLEAALKQVAYQSVALIERLGIDAVQVPHQAGETGLSRVQDEMEMSCLSITPSARRSTNG
jgi:hypothetical protein